MKSRHFVAVLAVLVVTMMLMYRRERGSKSDALGGLHGGLSTNSTEGDRSVPVSPQLVAHYIAERQKDPKYDWKRPVAISGRVVDEAGAPIEGVRVKLGVTDLSAAGSSSWERETDARGLFDLQGVFGKTLYVRLEKAGFWAAATNRRMFEFADPGSESFVPADLRDAVVFVMHHEPGPGVLSSFAFAARFEEGRTVVKVDPISHRHDADGIEFALGSSRTDLTVSVAKGGVLVNSSRFSGEAPEEGYEKSLRIEVPEESYSITKYTFFRLEQGPQYGAMTIEFAKARANWGGPRLRVEIWINTTGGRSLVHKADEFVVPTPY